MLISFGSYFAEHTHVERIVFVIDIFLISSLCFAVGMLLSSVINEYMTSELDRDKQKNVIFGEIVAECLFTTFLVYFVLFGVSLIPSIAKNPPVPHKHFRLIGGEFLLTFAIVACQLRMLDKIRFLFNEQKDSVEGIFENIIQDFQECATNGGNANNGKGFVCKPP